MIDAFLNLATAFGLSTSAGLNAYIPLLAVALLARFTNLVTLNHPWDALTSWWVIGVLVVLLVIEILVDKVPAADTVNDVIQTFIRPAAGAILFAASSNVIADIHPVLAAVCGVLIAGGVHVVKAGARPVVTAMTAGTANPILSTLEDIISFVTSLLAILVPYLLVALLVVVLFLVTWWYVRRRCRRRVVEM